MGWSAVWLGKLDVLTLALTIIWLSHLALLAWLTVRAWRGEHNGGGRASDMQGFVRFGNRISQTSAAVATAWLGFPILLLHPCA